MREEGLCLRWQEPLCVAHQRLLSNNQETARNVMACAWRLKRSVFIEGLIEARQVCGTKQWVRNPYEDDRRDSCRQCWGIGCHPAGDEQPLGPRLSIFILHKGVWKEFVKALRVRRTDLGGGAVNYSNIINTASLIPPPLFPWFLWYSFKMRLSRWIRS